MRHKVPGPSAQHLKCFLKETHDEVFNVVKLYRQYFLLKLTYQKGMTAEKLKDKILTHLTGGIHIHLTDPPYDLALDIWWVVSEFLI